MRVALLLLAVAACVQAKAQTVFLPKNLSTTDSSLHRAMPAVAARVIALYKEGNARELYENLFRYQITAGQYQAAVASLDSSDRLWGDTGSRAGITGLQFRSFALAKEAGRNSQRPFATDYANTLAALYNRLPQDQQEYATSYFYADTVQLKTSLDNLLKKAGDSDSLALPEARALVRAYNSWNVYRQILPVAKPFFKAEFNKRYVAEDNVLIPMPDGAQLSATIVRRVADKQPLPVVLMYNIYADEVNEGYQVSRATEVANKGYVSIILNTRGKKGSPQATEPFEHDAQDAYHAIDWISKQPWCNGKIGMYGGSYLGFSQWSATKKLHPALKTIVPQVAVGIGIDYPVQNGIFMAYMLRWIRYVTNNKSIDREAFQDEARWHKLYVDWFKSGRSFRDLDTMDGKPDALFQRWLDHPAHDSFWQNMVPYGNEFAAINIPILTTTGYFDDDQRGAFYYLQEHLKWNRNARHYLIIGPWDHAGGQGFVQPTIGRYKLDSVATTSVNETVFKWFDHILKDGPLPPALKDKVNFQVAGANQWRSAPSLKAASNDSLVLYLSHVKAADGYKLTAKKPLVKASITQEISYTDRERFDPNIEGDDLPPMDTAVYVGEDLVFTTEPLPQSVVMNGSLEGTIKAVLNKKDMDMRVRLYERTTDGRYFLLSWFSGRASYLKDRRKRTLLQPGREESITINNAFYGCRKLAKGSRIVAYVGMLKSPGWQVNYGTGRDVSDETIADGKVPLQIEWMNSSYIKVPLLR